MLSPLAIIPPNSGAIVSNHTEEDEDIYNRFRKNLKFAEIIFSFFFILFQLIFSSFNEFLYFFFTLCKGGK
jgi:hypothetical protein